MDQLNGYDDDPNADESKDVQMNDDDMNLGSRFINFSDSDNESPDRPHPAFAQNVKKQLEDPELAILREKRKSKRVNKICPPMYTTRQFSFSQNFDNNRSSDINLNDSVEKIVCKKNLFNEPNENLDPNTHITSF